jgi:hypothetical protein
VFQSFSGGIVKIAHGLCAMGLSISDKLDSYAAIIVVPYGRFHFLSNSVRLSRCPNRLHPYELYDDMARHYNSIDGF